MTRPSPFTTADVQRALKAAKGAGLHVISYEIDRDGTIRVLTGEPPATVTSAGDDAWSGALKKWRRSA